MKSQMLAGSLLYDAAVESTKNKEIYETYTAGTKREQSKIILDEAKNMLRGSPLGPKFNSKRNEIVHRKTDSFLKPLSKEDGKKGDGTNIATLVIDEYHQHTTTEFVDLALGSNSKDPLCIIITTAGMDLNSPCFTLEYKFCSDLLNPDSIIENDEYFSDICEAEEGDDIGNLETWLKANPLRASYQGGIDRIKTAYNIAKDVPEKMIAFKTKVLNIWVQGKEGKYMDMAKFRKCEFKELPFKIEGEEVYVGIDVSAKTDLCSVDFNIPLMINGVPKYIVFNHSFIPNMEKLREREIVDKVPYRSWAEQGFITITNTQVLDQNMLMDYVINFVKDKKISIKLICLDPNNSSKLMMDFEEKGYECVEVYQSHKSLNEATNGFKEEAYSENIYYEYNPVYLFAMENAIVKKRNGFIKIDKDATRKRIDPVDAGLCSYKLARYHEFDFDLSKYHTVEAINDLYKIEGE